MKLKKRKRETNTSHFKATDDDEEGAAPEDEEEDESKPPPAGTDLADSQPEIFPDKPLQISDFPPAFKRKLNRPHSSILALVSLERSLLSFDSVDERSKTQPSFFFENISHGQLQSLSTITADSPSLIPPEKLSESSFSSSSSTYICTPPPIMEGKGVLKKLRFPGPGNERIHVLPMHADWFSPTKVHRLERQVVPYFFTGKSNDHTPEKYIEIRNRVVLKYLENPERYVSVNDCVGLLNNIDNQELGRIVRFLDHWGIINYRAVGEPKICSSIRLEEDSNGDLRVPSASLKSIESLIQFDMPKSRLRSEDVSSSNVGSVKGCVSDLDRRIREKLAENRCSHCGQPCPQICYQSQKEADIILCSDCFHDGKFVAGNASIDFVRIDSTKDFVDFDGDNWSDQETLLLLEGLEIYNDNWNDIAEHVGTKSKAQCILHFIRLPMEDGLLENIELPPTVDASREVDSRKSFPNPNADSAGACLEEDDSEKRLPFAKAGNPVMALVAFLASAVGPRVAAACAHSALEALSKDDRSLDSTNNVHLQVDGSLQADRASSEIVRGEGGPQGAIIASEETKAGQGIGAPLSFESLNAAAKFGLSGAAMKAKLFADHEEREIQRLTAAIVNNQLKRAELKLKQFAEVENLLMKECEQVDRTRKIMAADRVRIMSATRFGVGGPATTAMQTATTSMVASLPPVSSGLSSSSSGRPPPVPMVAASSTPTNIISSLPPNYKQQQQQQQQQAVMSSFMVGPGARPPMFGFGPRLPLSAIQHPSASSAPSGGNGTIMFNSASANHPPNLTHPLLRPLPSANHPPNLTHPLLRPLPSATNNSNNSPS